MELNRIHQMDCVEGMRKMSAESVDLTITSPPYDDLRKYKGYSFSFDSVAAELYRVTKPGGVVVWVVGDKTQNGSETGTSFRQALHFMDVGFNLHDTMIYQKDSIAFPDSTRYYQIFEYMFILSKGKPRTFNPIRDRLNKYPGKRIRGRERQSDGYLGRIRNGNPSKEYGTRFNIWKYGTGYGKSARDKIAFDHPAIFPENLAQDHILSWTNPGDIVLDPFMGSGTTAKMAVLNDRQFVGFEVAKEYVQIAEIRIQGAKGQISTGK